MALRANSISEIIAPCEVYEIQLDLLRKSCAVKFMSVNRVSPYAAFRPSCTCQRKVRVVSYACIKTDSEMKRIYLI